MKPLNHPHPAQWPIILWLAFTWFCAEPIPAAESAAVFKAQITPHWFRNNTRFWYRNQLRGGTREFVLVDAERGTRGAAFDHVRLASALAKASGKECEAERLPFDDIAFLDDVPAVVFKWEGAIWKCDLVSHECSDRGVTWPVTPANKDEAGARRRGRNGSGPRDTGTNAIESPDGAVSAWIKEHNVFVRFKQGGDDIQLSEDGQPGRAYGQLTWAPDGRILVAFRIEPGERKEVYLVQSSPAGGGSAKLQSRPYALPGDRFTTYELNQSHGQGLLE